MNADHLRKLETELPNPDTRGIDGMDTLEILAAINREDGKIAAVIQNCLPALAEMVDHIYSCLENGGRLFYIGAGTSGRLGVLDASECPPTYGVSPDLVQGIIAGGDSALKKSSEQAEDSPENGKNDLILHNLTGRDAVIGLAASGRTPYVIGALDYARSVGAYTGAISCVSHAKLSGHAQTAIEAVTGPEAITGSTRMKAGTAQKMILNMVSTSVMVKMGKVYHNLMVDVQPTNEKLAVRASSILQECLGCSSERAKDLLSTSKNQVKLAILMGLTDLPAEPAQTYLEKAKGRLNKAVALWRAENEAAPL